MTKDEVLYAMRILKAMPIVGDVYTARVDGWFFPSLGVDLVNGDYAKLESLDGVFAFANKWGVDQQLKTLKELSMEILLKKIL